MNQNFNAIARRYHKLSFLAKLLLLILILSLPSMIRFMIFHDKWSSYTDPRFEYSIEYPAILWQRIDYDGFPGQYQETHMAFGWPLSRALTHSVRVGTVELAELTLESLVAWGEEHNLENQGTELTEPILIDLNGRQGLQREYRLRSRTRRVIYLIDSRGNLGYFIAVTASPMFEKWTQDDLDRIVHSFAVP